MHIASGLVFRAGQHQIRQALLIVVALCLALALGYFGAGWVADLLQPAPEVVIMAPFRW